MSSSTSTVSVGPPADNAAAELVKALNHPIRRSLLRYLMKSGPAKPADAQQALSIYVSDGLINFHLKVLKEAGAVVRERRPNVSQTFYASTGLCSAPWLKTVLELTAASDAREHPAPGPSIK